jgi:hypothetical protein
MVVDKRGTSLLRAMADQCRAAAKTASTEETFQKFMQLAADLDAGAASSQRSPGKCNGAA